MKLETDIEGFLKDNPFVKSVWPIIGNIDDLEPTELPVFHPDYPTLFISVSSGGTSQVHVFVKCLCGNGGAAMHLVNQIFAAARGEGNEMVVRLMPAVERFTSLSTNTETFRASTRFTITGKKGNIIEPRKDELGNPILVGTGAGAA